MRHFIITLLASFAFTNVAIANSEMCESLKECQELQKQAQDRIEGLQGNIPAVLGDFLRKENGRVLSNISQDQAYMACEEQGSRLPTARELAVNAVKYGAKMLELSEVNGKCPSGFEQINVRNGNSPTGKIDDSFCYSKKGYERPTGGTQYWIWASSLHLDNIYYAFGFNSLDGEIDTTISSLTDFFDSARCVVSSVDVE